MKKTNLPTSVGTNYTNVYTPSGVPVCEILVNNQKRKLYGKNKNKVYLNDGDYIQLSISNPSYERIGLQIEFNGKKEKNLLVLNPFQKAILDRFVDDKKRIQFNTFFVKDDKKTEKEIKDNGKLKIYFWKEKYHYQPIWTGIDNCYSSGSSTHHGLAHFTNISVRGTTTGDNLSSITTTNDTSVTAPDYETLGDTFIYQQQRPLGLNLKETGIIEKGEKSCQNLYETSFEKDFVFHEIKYKLLPFSQKEKNDVPKLSSFINQPTIHKEPTKMTYIDNYKNTSVDKRIYCKSCGYRIRSRSWKGCPMCLTPYC